MESSGQKIIIITAPSGAGKTSITRYLLNTYPDRLAFSVSATTRAARQFEKDKIDYYFLTEEAFKNKILHQEFVEWEMVYEGKYYGTLKNELQRIWDDHKIPVLDVDVKGALHVKRQYPEASITLFIEPPSINELKRRLESRGTESEASIQARVNKANFELSFKDQFDNNIVNDVFDRACAEAAAIVNKFINSNAVTGS